MWRRRCVERGSCLCGDGVVSGGGVLRERELR